MLRAYLFAAVVNIEGDWRAQDDNERVAEAERDIENMNSALRSARVELQRKKEQVEEFRFWPCFLVHSIALLVEKEKGKMLKHACTRA